MSKAVKLKNNLYLDTRGIVHNKNILDDLFEGNNGKGFNKICFGDAGGMYLDKYGNLITRSTLTSGHWHISNNGTYYFRVNWDTGAISGLDSARIYREYVLYNNTSGSNGTITLSDSAANYSYLEIYFKTNDGWEDMTRVFSPNNKKVTLNGIYTNASRTWVKPKGVQISGNKITNIASHEVRIAPNETVGGGEANNIYITRVIGLK